MSNNLFWVPLSEGRAWWPGVVVDVHDLDPLKYGDALSFWEAMRGKRGRDHQNKDVLVLLYGVDRTSDDEGHKFAVVPKTSLRPYQTFASAFGDGVVSTGKLQGQPCGQQERELLRLAQASLSDLMKRSVLQGTNGSLQQGQQQSMYAAASSGVVKPVRSNKSMLEEHKDLSKLKKELQQVRRRMSTRPAPRPQSVSPPLGESPIPNAIGTEAAQAVMDRALLAAVQHGVQEEYYPELTSQILRIWNFCHTFSQELNLSTMLPNRAPFAPIASFEASLVEHECSLFAHIASQLVSYLSTHCGVPETNERWDFSNQTLSVQLGSRCTALTWESLWDTLVNKGVVKPPSQAGSKTAILETLVQACSEVPETKRILRWRISEYESELANPIEIQASLTASHSPIELRSSNIADPHQLRFLTTDVFTLSDFYKVELLIDACRADHELVDPETGLVVWRTHELSKAMGWEEKLLAKMLTATRVLYLKRRIRSLSFGKDHRGRSLFSFVGDEDEEECRVWARDDASDRWFCYRGELNVARLADIVVDRDCRQELMTIVYASRKRFRPSAISAHRAAKNMGWRFTSNDLIGRKVIKYDIEFGLCLGVVASWRLAGLNRVVYRVVFTRQEWKTGVDMLEEDVIHLLACSDRLLGDFPLASATLTLPAHPFQVPWAPVHPAETLLVLVHGHHKKLIGLGVVLATTAQGATDGDCDALVLQDGGEFVTIFGKKNLHDAIRLGLTFAAPSTVVLDGVPVPRFNRIERFRPLLHHSGPLVGLQGVIKLWGKIVVDQVSDLRAPMLTSEQAFVVRAPNMWPSSQNSEIWREFVQKASTVKEFAIALECLLDFAERAVDKGYFTPPPPGASESSATQQDKTEERNEVKRVKAEEQEVEDLAILPDEIEDADRAIREVSSSDSSMPISKTSGGEEPIAVAQTDTTAKSEIPSISYKSTEEVEGNSQVETATKFDIVDEESSEETEKIDLEGGDTVSVENVPLIDTAVSTLEKNKEAPSANDERSDSNPTEEEQRVQEETQGPVDTDEVNEEAESEPSNAVEPVLSTDEGVRVKSEPVPESALHDVQVTISEEEVPLFGVNSTQAEQDAMMQSEPVAPNEYFVDESDGTATRREDSEQIQHNSADAQTSPTNAGAAPVDDQENPDKRDTASNPVKNGSEGLKNELAGEAAEMSTLVADDANNNPNVESQQKHENTDSSVPEETKLDQSRAAEL